MGWLSDALRALEAGKPAVVRPRGGSMRGRINDGEEVAIAPVDPAVVKKGDVVLVRWKRSHLLHLVTQARGDRLQIGNNLGRINGWVSRDAVVGRLAPKIIRR